ncbi:uncharacterized protein LOC131618426 [Vicia villosa]|uniref:uncharacterized protein LOC131618426 n=1 Tax=Vicia villosa TaxID=3911 RepID=UPI00273BE751|nr:uncharacterized protein LOC131618426 [Vicia villosa]
MGFNCVRLTWPTLLATDDTISNLKVRQSLEKHALKDSIASFHSNNPSIIDLTLIQAFQATQRKGKQYSNHHEMVQVLSVDTNVLKEFADLSSIFLPSFHFLP